MSTIVGTLVSDRTLDDVQYVKQLADKIKTATATAAEEAEYLTSLKGAYTASDLNRVESAVSFIAEELREAVPAIEDYAESYGAEWQSVFDLGYAPDDYYVTVKTNWSRSDKPTISDQMRYTGNVKLLINALSAIYPSIPDGLDGIGYAQANAIEEALKILYAKLLSEIERIETLIRNTSRAWYYSGDVYAGEVEA